MKHGNKPSILLCENLKSHKINESVSVQFLLIQMRIRPTYYNQYDVIHSMCMRTHAHKHYAICNYMF
jgi:hypothetical protein